MVGYEYKYSQLQMHPVQHHVMEEHTATVTGGASPYSYSWYLYNYTTGTSTTSNNNLCAGTYTVDFNSNRFIGMY